MAFQSGNIGGKVQKQSRITHFLVIFNWQFFLDDTYPEDLGDVFFSVAISENLKFNTCYRIRDVPNRQKNNLIRAVQKSKSKAANFLFFLPRRLLGEAVCPPTLSDAFNLTTGSDFLK